MGKLQDIMYEEEHVFHKFLRETLDRADEESVYWPLVKAAEKLTQSELQYLWEDSMGSFETTHSDYTGPDKKLLERAGPVLWFFEGYAHGVCDATPDEDF